MTKTNLVNLKDKYGGFDFNFLVTSTEDDRKIDQFKAAISDYYETAGIKVDYLLRNSGGHIFPNPELGNFRWGQIIPAIPEEVFAKHGIVPIGEKGTESYSQAINKSDSFITLNVDGWETPVSPPKAQSIVEQLKQWRPPKQENRDFRAQDRGLDR